MRRRLRHASYYVDRSGTEGLVTSFALILCFALLVGAILFVT